MDLPVVDLSRYLVAVSESRFDDGQLSELCCEVSRTLRETGALLVRDPRCSIKDNDRFIDMMERYFESPSEFKLLQERPQLHYQELNAEPVILEGFPEWKDTMDSWGYKMISAIETVAEMAAVGFGLPKDVFTSLMNQGPHLLAPTGSDLQRYGQEGTVFAGYHYDLNFLTIHGRSRFPGLNIWLRNGQKDEVKVPVGCLLIQAGKQIEWLTGGDCIAGMHEVVVTKRTIDAIKLASEQNHSLWRVSSTLFAQIALDAILKPLGHFAEFPLAGKYPSMYTGDYVVQELEVINLKERQSSSSSIQSTPTK